MPPLNASVCQCLPMRARVNKGDACQCQSWQAVANIGPHQRTCGLCPAVASRPLCGGHARCDPNVANAMCRSRAHTHTRAHTYTRARAHAHAHMHTCTHARARAIFSGAAMYLFEGYFGTVLCTGDFRYDPTLHDGLAQSRVDRVYLDNTFLDPVHDFPSREVALRSIVSLASGAERVAVGLTNLGKEVRGASLGAAATTTTSTSSSSSSSPSSTVLSTPLAAAATATITPTISVTPPPPPLLPPPPCHKLVVSKLTNRPRTPIRQIPRQQPTGPCCASFIVSQVAVRGE
jgi:hypothetical protein